MAFEIASTMSKLDPLELRAAFGKFMTGVTVVTAVADDGTPFGFTANSFSSVSLDPPLLLVCPAKSMSCFETFATCSYFHVSVLAHDQEAVSNIFASNPDNRFEQVDWTSDNNGCPAINGAIASFACRRDRSIDAGDHIILLGEVTNFESTEEHGLGYGEGGYFSLELERNASEVENLTHNQQRTVIAGALIECQNQLLLKTGGDGSLEFPAIEIADDQPSYELLQEHLFKLLKVPLTVGSVFSVFEHKESDKSSIYYRVYLEDQCPNNLDTVQLYKIKQIKPESFASDAIRSVFKRYLAERKSGNHSVYLGKQSAP